MTYPPEPPSPTYPPEAPPAYPPQKIMSPYPGPEVNTPPGFGADPDSDSSTAVAAKEPAAAVKDTAAQAGQQVADVAKSQAANVAEQARTEAQNFLGQTRDELSSQASAQQQRVAGGLRSLHSELQSMASNSGTDGPGTQVARQVADWAGGTASWLESREPGQVIADVQGFARKRPGTFLALAAVAGVLAGRLTRGLAADSSTDNSSASHERTGPNASPGNPVAALPPDDRWQTNGPSYAPDVTPAPTPPQMYETPQAGWTPDPVPPGLEGGYSAPPPPPDGVGR